MRTEWIDSAEALAFWFAIGAVIFSLGYFFAREVWHSRYKAAEADLREAYDRIKGLQFRLYNAIERGPDGRLVGKKK